MGLINILRAVLLSWFILMASSYACANPQQLVWQKLQQGLEYAEFEAIPKSAVGDSKIRILRINSKDYSFHLANASAPDEGNLMSVRNWAKKHGFVAAINASMYQENNMTSIALMRTHEHINNPNLAKHQSIFAFSSRNTALATLYDRECDNLEEMKRKYDTFIQNIRMLSCTGKNVWQPQKESFSTAAIATDKQKRILFIHVASAYKTHDLINILLKLPLNLRTMMYVEGGHQAQLYIQAPDKEFVLLGHYRTFFGGQEKATFGWPVPNVIGIKPKF